MPHRRQRYWKAEAKGEAKLLRTALNVRKRSKKLKLALIGAGQRGMIYAQYAYEQKGIEITAVAEPDELRRESAKNILNIPDERVFKNTDDFFKAGKLADALIIASMDRDHYGHAMKALDLGYDLLLEKPISPDPKECMDIAKKARETGCLVIVCHVLRYTTFFSTIKQLIDSGKYGKVVTIQHNENVGSYHIAHSFVRGNWGNKEKSSPIIMQKSCHDFDILCWLTGSNIKTVASFGDLTYFKEENAPKGSTERCVDCPHKEDCNYSALRAYLPIRGNWPATVLGVDQSEEGLMKAIKEGPYGRCAFRCDNNVCDHQVTIIGFENGVTADFSLSGFTTAMYRTINIMCEKGEIRGNDLTNTIEVTGFPANSTEEFETEIFHPSIVTGAHGGGDVCLMEDFLSILENKNSNPDSKSAVDKSIESHIGAFAAELARVNGCVIDVDELKEKIMKGEVKM